MSNVTLYSTKCPQCKVLEMKLKQKGIEYAEINDVDIMKSKGFLSAPQLEVDGVVYGFKDAVEWLKEQ